MHSMPWLFLSLQCGIVIASLLGYGIFTSRPELLTQVDPGARLFTWAFYGFAVGNLLFGGLTIAAEGLRDGKTGFCDFVSVYIVSLIGGLLGTASEGPICGVSYTELLGAKWFDRVPLLIPLIWFRMSSACWVIARQHAAGVSAIILSTALLIAWDLLLDRCDEQSDELLDL